MKNNKKGLWGIIVAIGLFLLSKNRNNAETNKGIL